MKKKLFIGILLVFVLTAMVFAAQNTAKGDISMEDQFRAFVKYYQSNAAPLEKAAALTYWKASITGKDADYDKSAKSSLAIDKFHSNKADFKKLKNFKKSGKIKDPVLSRELIIIYNNYLPKQIDEKLLKQITDLGTEVEKTFSTFRGKVDGKEITTNQIYDILDSSDDAALRQKAWEASQQVAEVVAPKLIELIKLRNKAAKQLGFKNYYSMMLAAKEINEVELTAIFDKLAALTDKPFGNLKDNMDTILAKKHKITKDKVMVWDYADPYFQSAPNVSETLDMSSYYKNKDVVKIVASFYKGIDLPINDILKRSSLYEAQGKQPHAYCTDIDRAGDVRMLLNMKDNENWTGTLLHESGHAVYSKNVDGNLPWVLRSEAHILTTEAIAEMFGRLTKNGQWLYKAGIIPKDKVAEVSAYAKESLRLEMLIFARWSQVMMRFEKALYENPDGDLNKLWWDIKEKYQFVKKPEGRNKPDWASKIHFTTAPVYYHNYLMGEMMASQLMHKMGVDILKVKNWGDIDFVNQPKLGDWLKKNIFEPGAKYSWNDLIKRATGEKLDPKYYAEQFIK